MAEFDEQLICAVKEGPCLYNVRSSDSVTWKEENAWVALSNKLNIALVSFAIHKLATFITL